LHLMRDLRRVTPAQGISPISAGLTYTRKFEARELPQAGFSVDYEFNAKRFDSFEWYLNAVEVAGDGLILHCHYATGLFERATVEGWLDALAGIFADLAADAMRDVGELGQFIEAETRFIPPIQYLLRATAQAEERLVVPGPAVLRSM
jgi:hypothetical protein